MAQTQRLTSARTVRQATWIQNIYSFVSVIIGICVGVAVRYVRRLKYIAVAGTLLFVLAFGLLYRYRGGVESHELAGLIGAEVILGVAGEPISPSPRPFSSPPPRLLPCISPGPGLII